MSYNENIFENTLNLNWIMLGLYFDRKLTKRIYLTWWTEWPS